MDVGGAVAVALLGGGTGLGAADAGGGVADFRRANKRIKKINTPVNGAQKTRRYLRVSETPYPRLKAF